MEPDDDLAAPLSACLERLAAGDLSARNQILELAADRLRALAHRMLARFPAVRRWEDTDDVFQNAALRLHRTLGQLPIGSPRDVMALAATELHRELLDLARRHAGPMSYAANHATNVIRRVGDAPRHVDLAPTPDDSTDRWTLFHDTIAALSADEREMFHLVWYLGMDQRSIARLLDCSERTVKSRWRAAREAVKAALDGEPPA